MLREIAFVDPGISNIDSLVSGLRPGIKAIVLSPRMPAPSQMASALRDVRGLEAIHVIAHGAPGAICFASGALSLETADDHAERLDEIGRALSADGQLVLWACDAGRGIRGAKFISALEDATGVEVVASTHLVGSAAFGGSWQLSARGRTLAAPLMPAAIQSYAGLLQTDLATTATETIPQSSGTDQLIVNNTNQIQSGDSFDGAGGFDSIIIATTGFPPLDVDLSAGGSAVFHNYEAIGIINSSGQSMATFSASQFGSGLISNSVVVGGDDGGTQILIVKDASNFSAAAWAFSTWQATDIVEILGTAGNDTITGSSQNDAIAGGAGNDTLDGGAGTGDGAYFQADQSTCTFKRVNATTWIVTDTSAAGPANQGSDTVTNFEKIGFFGVGPNSEILVSSLIGAQSDSNASANSIKENALNGTTVGLTAHATDGNGQAVTYSLTNSAGGRFAINATTGVVTVAKGLLLNFEQATSHVITVRATSPDHSFVDVNYTISVTNVSPETITGTAAAEILNGGPDINRILGLGGNDTIKGSNASETIIGGTSADKQSGNGGNDIFQITGTEGLGDTYSGGAGTDTLKVTGSGSATLTAFNSGTSSIEKWAGNNKGLLGTSGANKFDFTTLASKSGLPFVDGKAGNDTLIGSKFADNLRGGDGNDTLKGNAGSDELTGGKGKDIMTGGIGADDFNFKSVAEMGKTQSTRDVIKDFTHLSDDIDLSGLPGTLKFLSAKGAAFTGVAGQVHWRQSGGVTLIEGDTNGDKHVDFQIELTGLKTITGADLML